MNKYFAMVLCVSFVDGCVRLNDMGSLNCGMEWYGMVWCVADGA